MEGLGQTIEVSLLSFLSRLFGYKVAIIIEDLSMIILVLLFGYIMGQITVIRKFAKNNYVINESMRHFVYQKNEYKGVVEYAFKRPRTWIEAIEQFVGIHLASKSRTKLAISTAKWYIGLTVLVLIILFISLVLSFMFAIHVVSDLNIIK